MFVKKTDFSTLKITNTKPISFRYNYYNK